MERVLNSKLKNSENSINPGQLIFGRRITQLQEKVDQLIQSHKMMENMEKVATLREGLNFGGNFNQDFSTVKFEYNLKKPEVDKKKDEKDAKVEKMETSDETKKIGEAAEIENISRIPSNKNIIDILEKIDPLVTEYDDSLTTLSVWVQLQKSEYATGSCFGNEVIAEISKMLDKPVKLGVKEYFEGRAKLCQELEKNPGFEDFLVAVDVMDATYAKTLENVLKSMEQTYYLIYDCFLKNWKTITMNTVESKFLHL